MRRLLLKIILSLFLSLGLVFSVFAYSDSLLEILNPYQKVLRRYTRSNTNYTFEDLDARFKVYGTYLSPEFREAFLKRYQKYYPDEEPSVTEAKLNWAAPGQTEFNIALYAKSVDLKRVDYRDQKLWDLSLKVDGRRYKPVSIEELPFTSLIKSFYPYTNRWYRVYRVVFDYDARNAEPRELKVVFSGPYGSKTLDFTK